MSFLDNGQLLYLKRPSS